LKKLVFIVKVYQIKATAEKGELKAKFVLNQNTGTKEIIHFKNIDDAKGAPLIQQLFYLPFVKSVSLDENYLEVERFDILEWEDVIEEVRVQLENYLNDGGVILEEVNNDKVPVSIYAESTPNPSVMKFVANKKLVSESVEFKNIDEAKHSPFAQKLFHFAYVKDVFMNENYVSITKFDIKSWDEVMMEIREFIRAFIEKGNTIIEHYPSKNTNKKFTSPRNNNPLEDQIISILDEYIKPAVASDGGNIQFDSYDPAKKSVQVILQGACSGCPSSTLTLKNGIENMLKEMMPGKIENVVAING
jgi:Fe-S cluster biogenesis protein NfuA